MVIIPEGWSASAARPWGRGNSTGTSAHARRGREIWTHNLADALSRAAPETFQVPYVDDGQIGSGSGLTGELR